MRNKPFPYYDEFELIFGKYRAIGKGAETAADVIEELDAEETNKNIYSLDETDTSTSNTTPSRVRKRSNSSDSLASRLWDVNMMLGKLIEQHNEQMNMLVGRIGYECDLSERTGKIIVELMKMTHLSIKDQIKATKLIVSENENIDLFLAIWMRKKLSL